MISKTSGSALVTRAAARGFRLSPPVDRAGPQWFAAVMGVSILATCTERLANFIPGLQLASLGLVVLAWVVLVVIGAAFVRDVVRPPGRLRASITDLDELPFYGAVSMGLLAVGAATLAVGQPHMPAVATVVTWALWWVGMLLGVLTAVAFPMRLLMAGVGARRAPTPLWALPVVPPMVAAAGGAMLVNTLPSGMAASSLLICCCVLFALTLSLGVVVLGFAYGHLLRGGLVPATASPSYWIPVGIAGQSTAAANFILPPAARALPARSCDMLHALTVTYSVSALALGAVAAVTALWITVRALRQGLVFGPGWWSFTFPIGTMSLGLSAFGTTLGLWWLHAASAAVWGCLCGTVALCLVRSARLWATEQP